MEISLRHRSVKEHKALPPSERNNKLLTHIECSAQQQVRWSKLYDLDTKEETFSRVVLTHEHTPLNRISATESGVNKWNLYKGLVSEATR